MSQLTCLAPVNGDLESLIEQDSLQCFESQITSFLQALSDVLLKNPQAKAFPEVVALGFWLRQSNLASFKLKLKGLYKPLGLVVHFTPANVDTMFIYSWVCSLLLGNKNVIRVATGESVLQDFLFSQINKLMMEQRFAAIKATNLFVKFDKSSHFTEQLSTIADARVIWGGDESVLGIKSFTTPPRCRDICFSDRYSAAIINGDKLLSEHDLKTLAEKLWQDTKPYQQQACSSPKILFWLGSTENQSRLLSSINDLAAKGSKDIARLNNHLVTSQLTRAKRGTMRPLILKNICAQLIASPEEILHQHHLGHGMYFIAQLNNLEALGEWVDAKLQTLSYWGVDKTSLLKLLALSSITGIDRLVPVGQALDFNIVWDGFDLFSHLSRKINVE